MSDTATDRVSVTTLFFLYFKEEERGSLVGPVGFEPTLDWT